MENHSRMAMNKEIHGNSLFAWAEIGGFRDYIESKGDLTESKRW